MWDSASIAMSFKLLDFRIHLVFPDDGPERAESLAAKTEPAGEIIGAKVLFLHPAEVHQHVQHDLRLPSLCSLLLIAFVLCG